MSASPVTLATVRFFTQAGTLAPLAFGKLYSYAAGTNTPQALYSDAGGLSALPNPVILDANGEAQIWMGPNAYKFNLLNSANVQQANWPQDNIQSPIALAAAAQSAAQSFATAADTALAAAIRTEIVAQAPTYFTTAGTNTAYTLSPTVPILALAAGQRYNVKFHTGSGASPTLAISGLTAKSLKQYGAAGSKIDAVVSAGQISDVEYDGTDYLVLDPASLQGSNGNVRQVAYGGPIDSSTGLPIFLPTGPVASLTLTTQNLSASTPLRVTAANGVLDAYGIATSNFSWTLPNGSNCWLYVDIGIGGTLTPGVATLAPVYQWMGTPSTANGQHTFNISEMKMYVGNGSTATRVNRVFIGYTVTSGGATGTVYAYAYNARYSGSVALPNTSSLASISHRIGTHSSYVPNSINATIVATASDNGYIAGYRAIIPSLNNYLSIYSDEIAVYIATSNVAATIIPAAGGAPAGLTIAKWKVEVTISRSW